MSDNTNKQYTQKVVIEEFIATVNLFISEYCIEVLERDLAITEVYLHTCLDWTIDEKDELIKKLYDLELVLMERIETLNPETIVNINN